MNELIRRIFIHPYLFNYHVFFFFQFITVKERFVVHIRKEVNGKVKMVRHNIYIKTGILPVRGRIVLASDPVWCLVTREGEDLYLVSGPELLAWLRDHAEDDLVEITDADIRRWTMTDVPLQASLRQVMDTIGQRTVEAACIYERSRTASKPILHGVVTRESIEKFTLSRL